MDLFGFPYRSILVAGAVLCAALAWEQTIGGLGPLGLILVSVSIFGFLWVWDHRPAWIPSSVRKVAWLNQVLGTAPTIGAKLKRISDWKGPDKSSVFTASQWACLVMGFHPCPPAVLPDDMDVYYEYKRLKTAATRDKTLKIASPKWAGAPTEILREDLKAYYDAIGERPPALFKESRSL